MIITKRKLTIPVIAHVLNGSNFIPKDVRHSIVLRDMGLKKELILMMDSYTPELFADIAALGGLALANTYRRLVVDPERFENDEEEVMSLKGAIYTKTAFQQMLGKTYQEYRQSVYQLMFGLLLLRQFLDHEFTIFGDVNFDFLQNSALLK